MADSTPALINPLIRKVGIILVLSPFANFLYSSYLQQHSLLETAKSITVVNWVLWASALGAGLMMVKARQKSWLFAFFLMAINVLYGVFTFKKSMVMGGWPMVGTAWFQPTASLAVNIGFLIFIYRLEFHGAAVVKVSDQADNVRRLFPKAQRKKKFNVQLSKNVHVHFSGIGEWAQIIEVSETGLVVRLTHLLAEVPSEAIQNQELELLLNKDTVVHLRCFDVFDDFYEFHFTQATPEQLDQVKLWASS